MDHLVTTLSHEELEIRLKRLRVTSKYYEYIVHIHSYYWERVRVYGYRQPNILVHTCVLNQTDQIVPFVPP